MISRLKIEKGAERFAILIDRFAKLSLAVVFGELEYHFHGIFFFFFFFFFFLLFLGTPTKFARRGFFYNQAFVGFQFLF